MTYHARGCRKPVSSPDLNVKRCGLASFPSLDSLGPLSPAATFIEIGHQLQLAVQSALRVENPLALSDDIPVVSDETSESASEG